MKTIIILGSLLLGSTTGVFGQIQGDIADINEKGISNAIIIATDSLTKVADTVRSDNRGFYDFKKLKPGKYKIEVKAQGYKPAIIENVIVKEGDVGYFERDLYRGQRIDITLSPAKLP